MTPAGPVACHWRPDEMPRSARSSGSTTRDAIRAPTPLRFSQRHFSLLPSTDERAPTRSGSGQPARFGPMLPGALPPSCTHSYGYDSYGERG